MNKATAAESGNVEARLWDVVIVGAGFGGSLLALRMGQAGRSVLLIDRQTWMKPVFRAEKLETAQSERLRRLGVLELRRPLAPPTGSILRFDARGARIVDTGEQFGISYHDTVNAIRSAAQDHAGFVAAEVVGVDASATDAWRETVLRDGRRIRGRLVVLSCGYRPGIHRRLGVAMTQDPSLRSLFIGFDVELADPQRLTHRGCNEHLDQGRGGIDYLTLFRVGDRLRANLSAQFRVDDPRDRLFRAQPEQALREWFPQLAAHIGDFRITSRFDRFVTTYYRIQPPEAPGVVAIGDMFQSASPATGTGLTKVLTDVELLIEEFVPRWLASGSCDRGQLKQFYAHAQKLHEDRRTHNLWESFLFDAKRRASHEQWRRVQRFLDPRKLSLGRMLGRLGPK